MRPSEVESYDLMQTLRSTETSWASADDKNVDLTGEKKISSWVSEDGLAVLTSVRRP